MSIETSIANLEKDIVEFKASQLIGSSSSRVVPIATIDVSADSIWYNGISVVGKFTTTGVINPIIMPRLTVEIDGQEMTSEDSRALIQLQYDDYWAAQLIDHHTQEGYILPDEKTATFFLYVLSNVEKTGTTNFKVKGTVYATCEGNYKTYTFVN